MKPRIKKTYSITAEAADTITALADVADCSDSHWLSRHMERLASGATAGPGIAPQPPAPADKTVAAAPRPAGIPGDLVRVTLVESDAGKTAWMRPHDAGLTDAASTAAHGS